MQPNMVIKQQSVQANLFMAQQLAWQSRESEVWGSTPGGSIWYPTPSPYETLDPAAYPLAAPSNFPEEMEEDALVPSFGSTSAARLAKEAKIEESSSSTLARRKMPPPKSTASGRYSKYATASRDSDSDTSSSNDDDDRQSKKGSRFKSKRAGKSVKERKERKQRKVSKQSGRRETVDEPDGNSWRSRFESIYNTIMFEVLHGERLLNVSRFMLLFTMVYSIMCFVLAFQRLLQGDDFFSPTGSLTPPGLPTEGSSWSSFWR
jgi:hypothetical protein